MGPRGQTRAPSRAPWMDWALGHVSVAPHCSLSLSTVPEPCPSSPRVILQLVSLRVLSLHTRLTRLRSNMSTCDL